MNDPNTTCVTLKFGKSPERPIRLGQALENNRMVTKIDVEVSAIGHRFANMYEVPILPIRAIQGIKRFIESSPQLSSVGLHQKYHLEYETEQVCFLEWLSAVSCNKNITTLRLSAAPFLITEPLVNCLNGKQDYLRSLELRLRYSLAVPFATTGIEKAITNIPNLTSLSLDVVPALVPTDDPEEEDLDGAGNLFHHADSFYNNLIRGLENQQSVSILKMGPTTSCLPILRMILRNNTGVKNLSLSASRWDWSQFCSLLREALTRDTSLESFDLRDVECTGGRFEEMQKLLGLYMANNRGLRELHMTRAGGRHDHDRSAPVHPALLQGFEKNTSLIRVKLDWCEKGSDCKKAIDSYTLRNNYSKRTNTINSMLHDQEDMYALWKQDPASGTYRHHESALSVAFECLRGRHDWYDQFGETSEASPLDGANVLDGGVGTAVCCCNIS